MDNSRGQSLDSDPADDGKQAGFRWPFPLTKAVTQSNGTTTHVHPFINSTNDADNTLIKLLLIHKPYDAPFGKGGTKQQEFVNLCKEDPGDSNMYPLKELKQYATVRARLAGYNKLVQTLNDKFGPTGDDKLNDLIQRDDGDELPNNDYKMALLIFRGVNNVISAYTAFLDGNISKKLEEEQQALKAKMQSDYLKQAAVGTLEMSMEAGRSAATAGSLAMAPIVLDESEDADSETFNVISPRLDMKRIPKKRKHSSGDDKIEEAHEDDPKTAIQILAQRGLAKEEARNRREQRKMAEAEIRKQEAENRKKELELREKEMAIQSKQIEALLAAMINKNNN